VEYPCAKVVRGVAVPDAGRIEVALLHQNPDGGQGHVLIDLTYGNICCPSNLAAASDTSRGANGQYTNALSTAIQLETGKRTVYPSAALSPNVLYPAAFESTGATGPGTQELFELLRSLLAQSQPSAVVNKKLRWLKRRLAVSIHLQNANMFIRHARHQCPDRYHRVVAPCYYDAAAEEADNAGLSSSVLPPAD